MISIIILSYQNPALLRLCLKSLVAGMKGESDYEVIVVDNATIIETRNVITQEFDGVFPCLKTVAIKENAGYTRGVNEGVRASSGEYILALNYDIVVEAGAVRCLADYLHDHPEIGLIGPRLVNFDGTHQNSYFRFYNPFTIISRRVPLIPGSHREQTRFTMRNSDPSQPAIVDWVSGAAFMTTRPALERIGYMDESLFHYFSDVDWAWRFWENGYVVAYYPMAAMFHYHGRTSKGRFGIFDPLFNQATRWHIKDAIRYFSKHGISGHRPKIQPHRQPQLITSQP